MGTPYDIRYFRAQGAPKTGLLVHWLVETLACRRITGTRVALMGSSSRWMDPTKATGATDSPEREVGAEAQALSAGVGVVDSGQGQPPAKVKSGGSIGGNDG